MGRVGFQVFSGTVYQVGYNGSVIKFLVLYNISGNHCVGFPIYDTSITNSVEIKSIKKYVIVEELMDIQRNNFKNPLYISGEPMQITIGEMSFLNKETKKMLIKKIDSNTSYKVQDDISCLKWDVKKIELNKQADPVVKYNRLQIVWIDFGYNVGSELRKLRPAILWKASGDKKVWNVIPLSTKCSNDNYYFHYDITSVHDCSAKIESMTTFSSKRIVSPYYEKSKQAYISKTDEEKIISIIKAYYTYDQVELNKLNASVK